MTDPVRGSDQTPPARPAWVKAAMIATAVVIAIGVALAIFAGGDHGPGRHVPGGDHGSGHKPPVQHAP